MFVILSLYTGNDVELTTYVLLMLAQDDRTEGVIKTGSGCQLLDSSQGWLGSYFGPHHITELLGEGGMSLVFLAERTDGAYEGTVALKLIKNPAASADIKNRFLRMKMAAGTLLASSLSGTKLWLQRLRWPLLTRHSDFARSYLESINS